MVLMSYLKTVDKNKALVFDGTGKYIKTCNLCGRKDLVFPTSSLYLCPNCVRKGDIPYSWIKSGRAKVIKSGYCDLCGVHFVGAGLYVSNAMACFKCLWTRLGRHSGALRPEGRRLV